MRTLELNPEFNLLGQIDLNNVKIALDRDEMEETVGGYHRPGGGGVRNWLKGCGGAGAGLVLSFYFLATAATVASAGGAAVGFIFASAVAGAACGD